MVKIAPVHSSTRRVPSTVLIHAAAGVTTICAAEKIVLTHDPSSKPRLSSAEVGKTLRRDPHIEGRDERADQHRDDSDDRILAAVCRRLRHRRGRCCRDGHGGGGVVSVRIVAMTDIPGRNLPASGLSSAILNLTGIRSTTLVKLPVALSGGSRLNCEPLAGAMLSTIAVITTPGKVSTRISARWPIAT